LLSLYNVLLYKYTGQDDICVGVPIANREQAEITSLIGFFVNTIAIRTSIDRNASFESLLKEVRAITLGAYAHQEVPFERVVDRVVAVRDRSRSPLFQTMFTLQNTTEITEISMQGCEVSFIDTVDESAKFDLEFIATEKEAGLSISIQYCTDLFRASTIARMGDHFSNLIMSVLKAPELRVGSLEMLGSDETHDLLERFNDTTIEYATEETFLDVFSRQVTLTPDALAVKYQNHSLSYRELDERSNQLAHYLLSTYALQPEDLVLLMMDRSEEFLISMLGIWKAGGAYIPVVPDTPEARTRHIAEVSGARVLITSEELLSEDLRTFFTAASIGIMESCFQYKKSVVSPSGIKVRSSQLSYIIFTSGSTGTPKGAMIEHRGMLNHLYSKLSVLDLSSESIIAQNASQSFDISVWQFIAALMVGGTTSVYSLETILDPVAFVQELVKDQVTILEVVPSYLSVLLDNESQGYLSWETLDGLKYLMVTGETLLPNLANRWVASHPEIPIINAYGPTEASDDITHYTFHEPVEGMVPIGYPVQNMKIYILNADEQLSGVGIKGELCVSGIGVGRGYLKDAARTSQVFVADPFRASERMYRTGDVARFCEDGVIEFFGRNDHQVKIRGHRIELGEIE
ncbi:non-ribosomal peptide synthetase, partial [Ascidiimonas meishanensis]|uniref:non-ribosomal peptide synthetase n=1 Tax=Ascidiimonas meishanensis TaxID=3128903 RepID=UPI0039B76412